MSSVDISVLYFARAGDLAGTRQAMLALDEPCSVRDAVRMIAEQRPELAELLERCRFAVNQEFVDDDSSVLCAGDELAVLPPVSGG